MIKYQHTQIGYLIIFVFIGIALFYGLIFAQAGLDYSVLVIMAIVLFLLASVMSLNVTINENYLRIKFGYGIFRKNFLLSDIASAKIVKNHWYFGWGIRWWPSMWVYNVSGFDAVEIILKSGRIYRIGTDEPEKLELALNTKIPY